MGMDGSQTRLVTRFTHFCAKSVSYFHSHSLRLQSLLWFSLFLSTLLIDPLPRTLLYSLLLLLLSRFSRVRLFTTPWTAAYQAPLPMGFSRQEYWSGLPLPSPTVLSTSLQNTLCYFLWAFAYYFPLQETFFTPPHHHCLAMYPLSLHVDYTPLKSLPQFPETIYMFLLCASIACYTTLFWGTNGLFCHFLFTCLFTSLQASGR